MLLPDTQVFYHMSELSNAGNMVPVMVPLLPEDSSVGISSINPSDPTALTRSGNVLTPKENYGWNYAGLVTA